MEMKKICNKCGNKLPTTKQYFYRASSTIDGLRGDCKKCNNKASAIRQKENPSIHNIACRRYYQKHKEKVLQYAKKYSKTPTGKLRQVFAGIKQRCYNPNCEYYEYYGGRGISCEFSSPEELINYVLEELKINPVGLQIDRIDNDGNYERGNIRFITAKENCNNRSNNVNNQKGVR